MSRKGRLMHFINYTIKVVILISFVFSLSSCSFLQKVQDKIQGKNQIEGEGAGDISSTDIDEGQRGSDGGIDGLSTIFFGLDSSVLSSETKASLKANKAWLDKNSQVVKLELEGHCDLLGSEAYNVGLGRRRAQQVLDYLKTLGVSEDKITIISYGEERPLSQTENSLNRRVNFVPIY